MDAVVLEQPLRTRGLSIVLGLVALLVIAIDAVTLCISSSTSDFLIVLLVTLVVLLLVIFFFVASLKVVVRVSENDSGRRLEIRYGPGGRVVQTFKEDVIVRASAQRLTLMQMGGWGYRGSMRLMKRAALVTRAGDALQLQLVEGRQFTVTVDEPSRFVQALRF